MSRGKRSWRAAGAGIAMVAASAASLAGAAGPSAAATAPASSHRTICDTPSSTGPNPGAYVDGKRYWVEDDRFGTLDAKQCLTLTPHGRPAFRVSTSQARAGGNPVQAYPFIQYGCYWGWCTPGSTLPLRISNIHSATSTWYTSEKSRGIWNAGYDLWLNSTPLADGHADRAEMMIWLNSTSAHYQVGGPAGTRKVRVDGHSFYLTHWRTGQTTIPGGWEYIQYRLTGRPWHAKNLHIAALLLDAARRHLISKSWYLQGVLAGDEIWRGGQGLATTWFSVNVVSKQASRRPKPVHGHKPGCKPHSRYCPHTSTPPGPGYGQPPVPLTMPFGP
ncbi:MAG TPA: hypothetical protein VGG25_30520 [Streptosporangiaceae bacterium]|jgi:hypothetical protein